MERQDQLNQHFIEWMKIINSYIKKLKDNQDDLNRCLLQDLETFDLHYGSIMRLKEEVRALKSTIQSLERQVKVLQDVDQIKGWIEYLKSEKKQ